MTYFSRTCSKALLMRPVRLKDELHTLRQGTGTEPF